MNIIIFMNIVTCWPTRDLGKGDLCDDQTPADSWTNQRCLCKAFPRPVTWFATPILRSASASSFPSLLQLCIL